VRHQHRRWKGRAPSASAGDIFEHALLGEPAHRSREFDPRTDRKTLQLCRQIHRALILAVGGELPGNLSVESVEPLGSASQLLVRVVIHESTPAALSDAMIQLNERTGAVRALISRSIHRKRAPNLTFVAIPIGATAETGGWP
jgi:ribosome-binding factor A